MGELSTSIVDIVFKIEKLQLFSFPPSDDTPDGSRPDSPVRKSSSDLIFSDVVSIKKLLIQLQVERLKLCSNSFIKLNAGFIITRGKVSPAEDRGGEQ